MKSYNTHISITKWHTTLYNEWTDLNFHLCFKF